MAGWHDFYEMIGGVAATLLGLLFVSVSLNAEIILGQAHRGSRRLAEQAFQNYLAVVIVALLVLFPTISRSGFAQTVLAAVAIWGGWAITRLVQSVRHPPPNQSLLRTVRRHLPALIGFGMLGYGAAVMLLTRDDVSGLLAAANLVLLISATVVSWELLVQVASEKFAATHPGKEKRDP